MFFSLDGLDGTGKSTQVALLTDWLRQQNFEVLACRDPGSTPLGEAIRGVLLDDRVGPIARRSEMLLYMAARAQLVDEAIAPALAEGKVVISDRYLLANVVYQGYAGGLDIEQLWQIGHVATQGVEPTLTIVLDMPAEAAASRIQRPADRMECQGDAFRQAVRDGFLTEAARRPDRIVVVDAARPIDVVQQEIRCLIGPRLRQEPKR